MHVQQVPAEHNRIMITEYLVAMHNSVRADGRRRASRIAPAILLSPSMGALIAPVSSTWSNYIVLGPEHSFVNPVDGNGYGNSRPKPTKKTILTSFYRMRPGGRDHSPRLLLEAEADGPSDWIYVSACKWRGCCSSARRPDPKLTLDSELSPRCRPCNDAA